MNVNVPFIENNIPGINHRQWFSDSQLDTANQFISESQILLQSLQGNSVLSQQDQLSSLIISLQLSSSYLTLADPLMVLLWIFQEKMSYLLVLVIYYKVETCSRTSIISVYMEKTVVRLIVRSYEKVSLNSDCKNFGNWRWDLYMICFVYIFSEKGKKFVQGKCWSAHSGNMPHSYVYLDLPHLAVKCNQSSDVFIYLAFLTL